MLAQVPTVALDTAASRSVLSASIEDLVERLHASPPPPPPSQTKAEWMAARDAAPRGVVARFTSAAGAGANGGEADGAVVEAAVGARLLEKSKGVKPLAPLAFLLQVMKPHRPPSKCAQPCMQVLITA